VPRSRQLAHNIPAFPVARFSHSKTPSGDISIVKAADTQAAARGSWSNIRDGSDSDIATYCLLHPPRTDIGDGGCDVRFVPILLQKSQKAQGLISRQRTKQAAIADQ
jgi:hypothetical protein